MSRQWCTLRSIRSTSSLAATIAIAASLLGPAAVRAQFESATSFGSVGFDGLFNYRVATSRFRFNEGVASTAPVAMFAVQARLLRQCDPVGDTCGLDNGTRGLQGALDTRTFFDPDQMVYPVEGGKTWYEPSRFTNTGDCWSGNEATCPALSIQNIGMIGCLVPVYSFDRIGYVARSCIRDGFDGYVTFSWRLFWLPSGAAITESDFVVTPHWTALDFDQAGNPIGSYDVTATPEPATVSLMAIALLGLAGTRRVCRTVRRGLRG